ncbi:MAG: threonine synthase [bacterium]
MMWYSTADPGHRVSFREAVLQGLAPGQGLYMPATVPLLSDTFFRTAPGRSFPDIAFDIAQAFLRHDLDADVLRHMIDQTLTFDTPLVEIEPGVYALELFHGPTLAFKDVGARFMAQLLAHYAQQIRQQIVVLVATSGDTGGAVANGFFQVPGVRVVVLYPSGKVSELQEKQFTTLGHNITAIEVAGTFDDCQRLVKSAFSDPDLTKNFFLTSANSINVGRLLPQIFYYVYAWSRAPKNVPVVFSVPSGNFGNLMAGLLAQLMGLAQVRFIAATNANAVVPAYLSSGQFQPRPSVPTISNAMDVGNPSNFTRILDLYGHNHPKIQSLITGITCTDDETAAAMRDVYQRTDYLLDPHGAVAYLGLTRYRQPHETGIFLETAHPAKFKSVVDAVLSKHTTLPEALHRFALREKKSITSPVDLRAVKRCLRE